MTSFALLLAGRWTLGGILLGIAAGCRVSSFGLVAPFALLALDGDSRSPGISRVLRFTLACVVVTGLCFVPVILQYGSSFLTVYQAPYPAPARLAYRASLELWGTPGALALTILAAAPAAWAKLRAALATPGERRLIGAATGSIGVTVVTFLLHPDKSVYLIPAIPFTLLLAWKALTPGRLRILIGSLLASPLVLSVLVGPAAKEDFALAGRSISVEVPGPLFVEASRRRAQARELERLGSAVADLPAGSVLVAGWWLAEIRAAGLDREARGLEVVEWLDQPAYEEARRAGRAISVAPGQIAYNLPNTGFDLERAGARTLVVSPALP
jgi:hypothetical protein